MVVGQNSNVLTHKYRYRENEMTSICDITVEGEALLEV